MFGPRSWHRRRRSDALTSAPSRGIASTPCSSFDGKRSDDEQIAFSERGPPFGRDRTIIRRHDTVPISPTWRRRRRDTTDPQVRQGKCSTRPPMWHTDSRSSGPSLRRSCRALGSPDCVETQSPHAPRRRRPRPCSAVPRGKVAIPASRLAGPGRDDLLPPSSRAGPAVPQSLGRRESVTP